MWDRHNPPKHPHGVLDREITEAMREFEQIKSRIISDLEHYKCHLITELTGLDGETQRKLKEIILRYEDIAKRAREEFDNLNVTAKAYMEHADDVTARFERQIHLLNNLEIEFMGLKRHVANNLSEIDHRLTETATNNFAQIARELATLRNQIATIVNTNLPPEMLNPIISAAVETYVRDNESALSTKEETESVENNADSSGVYCIPLKFTIEDWKNGVLSQTFKIPKGGFSVRNIGERNITYGGNVLSLTYRVYIFKKDVGGSLVEDTEAAEKYTFTGYESKITYIPYIENRYAYIDIRFIGEDKTAATIGNAGGLYPEFAAAIDAVRVYGGKVKSGNGLIGTTPATINRSETAEGFGYSWNFITYTWKYGCVTSILPLRYVDKITVNPDLWVNAKVYTFDPVKRTHVWKETRNFYDLNPVFGASCEIDFSDCGENDYAIIGIGRVPFHNEYEAVTRDGSSFGTANIGIYGLNREEIEGGVFVHWKNNADISHTTPGTSVCVAQNMNVLKSAHHRTATALFGNDTSSVYKYLYEKQNFAGVFYGGEYIGGTFFYNVSPVAYFTALLNPNSNAYGESVNEDSGHRYGIKCSAFTSLLHGHPIPRTTFDYRYNRIPGYDLARFAFNEELGTLKKYDVLCQGAEHTGHCVIVSDVVNIGNELNIVKVIEATTPATGENIFPITGGAPYIRENPETWYNEQYTFVGRFKPEYDRTIANKANFVMPYTTPQKVMNARGYGSIYLVGVNKVVLSVSPDVAELNVYKNGEPYTTYSISALSPTLKNGYNVIVLPLADAGEYTIYNNVDSGAEKFALVDASMFSVTAERVGNEIRVYVSHPDDVKYVEALYKCEGYEKAAPMCFDATYRNGYIVIPAEINTEMGVWTIRTTAETGISDSVNVVFHTKHDTNTFWVDAENDKGV